MNRDDQPTSDPTARGPWSVDSEPLASNGGRPLFVPRALVMFGAIWAFVAWILLFGTEPPLQSQSASYAPSMQLFAVALAVGVVAGWPLLRLSGPRLDAPIAQSAIDAVAILTLGQIVLWPLRLLTTWTIARTIAIDAALAASVAFVGAWIALAAARDARRARGAMMFTLALLALLPGLCRSLEPVLPGLVGVAEAPWLVALSPPALLYSVARPDPIDPGSPERFATVWAFVWAVSAWILALFLRLRQRAPADLDREA